jgi:hypothetical protein
VKRSERQTFFRTDEYSVAKDDSGEVPANNNGQKDHHNDLYHWVYVAGATIILGIVDFITLYPVSHLLSFTVQLAIARRTI